jgi:hypothetical protein
MLKQTRETLATQMTTPPHRNSLDHGGRQLPGLSISFPDVGVQYYLTRQYSLHSVSLDNKIVVTNSHGHPCLVSNSAVPLGIATEILQQSSLTK